MVTPHAREAAGVVITDAEDKARASKATGKVADMVMAKAMVKVKAARDKATIAARAMATATIGAMIAATTEARVATTKVKVKAKATVMATRASAVKAEVRDVITIKAAAMVGMAISNDATIRARETTPPGLQLISPPHRSPVLMCQAKSSSWLPRHQVSYR